MAQQWQTKTFQKKLHCNCNRSLQFFHCRCLELLLRRLYKIKPHLLPSLYCKWRNNAKMFMDISMHIRNISNSFSEFCANFEHIYHNNIVFLVLNLNIFSLFINWILSNQIRCHLYFILVKNYSQNKKWTNFNFSSEHAILPLELKNHMLWESKMADRWLCYNNIHVRNIVLKFH